MKTLCPEKYADGQKPLPWALRESDLLNPSILLCELFAVYTGNQSRSFVIDRSVAVRFAASKCS